MVGKKELMTTYKFDKKLLKMLFQTAGFPVPQITDNKSPITSYPPLVIERNSYPIFDHSIVIVQFPDVVDFAEEMASEGKTIIVAALDGTFQRQVKQSKTILSQHLGLLAIKQFLNKLYPLL